MFHWDFKLNKIKSDFVWSEYFNLILKNLLYDQNLFIKIKFLLKIVIFKRKVILKINQKIFFFTKLMVLKDIF